MPKSRLLVLSYCSDSRQAADLRDILVSCSAMSLDVELICGAESLHNGNQHSISEHASRAKPDLSFLILPPSAAGVTRLVQTLRRATSGRPVAIVVEESNPTNVLEALKAGASDFIVPPLRTVDVLARVMRLLGPVNREKALVDTIKEKQGLKRLIGASPAFVLELRKIPLISRCNATVLIQGETGTGKEMCARAIHYLSPQADKPFVPVNCGAIPVDLVENELFGHQSGAFTGARTSQPGLIEEANGGTLFLDEVDSLPMLAQVKLLRFLHDGEFRPLGSTKVRRASVRIIAATNTDLEQSVSMGKTRQDLYYRLNIVQLTLPPLRDRAEDIVLLAEHFLAKYASEFERQVTDFTPEALRALATHHWPGNVRELEHVVQRAVVLSEQDVIDRSDLSLPFKQPNLEHESLQEAKARMVGHFEQNYIRGLLVAYKGNITRAAKAAGKNRRAFWELIRKHRIDVESLKLESLRAQQ
ncbi:MAG: sigma-54 dependent transcriptional regulator [Blastocatellia bacterium]